jgi:hypothetical protein
MSLASCLDWPFSRRSSASDDDRRVGAAAVELDRRDYAAGDTVRGRVRGVAGPAAVALVRLEERPHVNREYIVARAEAARGDGAFALSLPSAALPTVTGDQCALRYAAVALSAVSLVAPAELRVSANAVPHLPTARSGFDRLLADWDARHFHIELFDAQLQGGGRLAGRVHRHGCWPPGPIEVRACCLESWRFRPSSEGGTPQWHASYLWQTEHPLAIDPDAGWAAFCFALPGHLPPGVEARTIAWRYELRAQRHVRHWFNETAARTPLLHEDATLRAQVGVSAADMLAAGRSHRA